MNTLVDGDLERAAQIVESSGRVARRSCEIRGWDGKAAARIVDELVAWTR